MGINTNFFHSVIKEKRRRNITQIIQSDGSVTVEAKLIGEIAEDYFQTLFQATEYHLDESLFDGIQPILSSSENSHFCRTLSSEEI